MKYLLCVFLICSSSFSFAGDTVRILLSEEKSPLEFTTPYPVRLKSENRELNLSLPKLVFSVARGPAGWIITTKGKGGRAYELPGKVISLFSTYLYWNSNRIHFPISLVHKKGTYQLVGHMNIEEYLKGVLPHEMPSSWPLEALKAQAVASRSYALWKAGSQKSSHYDLRTSILDQMFRMNKIGESLSTPAKVEETLRATEGLVLLDTKSNVVKTYFHSDCGGATDGARNVWGTEQPQNSIRDIACAKRSSSWQSAWSKENFQKKLSAELFLPAGVELKDVVIRTQLESDRVEWVDLIFSHGILKRARGEDIRRMLGFDKIKSTLFTIEKQNSNFVFSGRGFGHGVGLCQYGARAMAQAGNDYKTILYHYYPKARLRGPLPLRVKEAPQSVSSL